MNNAQTSPPPPQTPLSIQADLAGFRVSMFVSVHALLGKMCFRCRRIGYGFDIGFDIGFHIGFHIGSLVTDTPIDRTTNASQKLVVRARTHCLRFVLSLLYLSVRDQLREHVQQRVVVEIEILVQVVEGPLHLVRRLDLGLPGRLDAPLRRRRLGLLGGHHRRAGHQHESLAAPAGAQQRLPQVDEGLPVPREDQGGPRDVVAAQLDGEFPPVNHQELPDRREGVEDLLEHGGLHAATILLLVADPVRSPLHYVHAVQEMAEHHGRVRHHVVGRPGVVQQEGVFDDDVRDAQEGLDLRVGEAPRVVVFVPVVQEGVHRRHDEMHALVLVRAGRHVLVLLQQRKGRQDHVPAAQLVFVGQHGRRRGGDDGFLRDGFHVVGLGFLRDGGKPAVGLVATGPHGAGQGVQGPGPQGGLVVQKDRRGPLDPVLVAGVRGDAAGVAPDAVFGFDGRGSGQQLRRAIDGRDGVVDAGDLRLVGVVDHVGPGVEEGDGGQECRGVGGVI
mmetsp:Transcript_22821/g.50940  ORF Transcript_22821/g.50940 Transcript_22821/m.50940 type:complete len:501 (-) Transcript_22821:653-2155(-)